MEDVLVIGDAHTIPGEDLRRWFALREWLKGPGKAIRRVVIIGDFMDMGSLNRFDTIGAKAMEGARIEADIASGELALDTLLGGIGKGREIIFVEGNHEERLQRMYEEHPKLAGLTSIEERLGEVAEDHGASFSYTPYREYTTIAPGFVATHIPHNNMQPIGEARVLSLSAKSVIYGHTHKLFFSTLTRNGAKQIYGLNVGCYIDPKHDPAYMKGKIKDWWRGVIVLHLEEGQPWRGEFTPISLQQLLNGEWK